MQTKRKLCCTEKILDNIDFGSEIITDESKSYIILKHYFKHNFINHSKGETEGSRANMENKEIASEYSRQDLSRVAFIRSIYSLSMVCYDMEFENDNIRQEIVSQSKNPLDLFYIVDLICTSKGDQVKITK